MRLHVCRVESGTGLPWRTSCRWGRCLRYRRYWNWAPIHIQCTGTVVQVNAASFTVALVLPWPLCHRGALPHPNSLESRFQYNRWAPMSVIPMINSSFSPSMMRTVALTSFPVTYIFIRYLPNTFMAPLFALPWAECVSGSLIGRLFSGIFLKSIVLMQLTSAPVSYRALMVNEFSILQLINGLECKEFILYSTWSQTSFLILLINWGVICTSEMSRTVLRTTVQPAQSLKPDNLRLWWHPPLSQLFRWPCTACPARWSSLCFLWSACSIPYACVQTSCSICTSWAPHFCSLSWVDIHWPVLPAMTYSSLGTSWMVPILSGFGLCWEPL